MIFAAFIIQYASASSCDLPAGGDRRLDRTRLKIVQFNVKNLFTGVTMDWPTPADVAQHVAAIAAQLDRLDGDIFHLCEVEECVSLSAVKSAMKNGAQYRIFFVPGVDTTTGQNVILFSRVDPVSAVTRATGTAAYPIADSKCAWSGPAKNTQVSKHLIAEFNVSSFAPFVLVGAHLKAKQDGASCAQREGQATVLRDVVRALAASKSREWQFVLLGDFNDYDGATLDARGDVPTSRTLDILRSSLSSASAMTNVASFATREDRWSFCSAPFAQTMIDHILLSEGFAQLVSPLEGAAFNEENVCGGAFASDHRPVAVTLDVSASASGVVWIMVLLVVVAVLWFVVVCVCIARRGGLPLPELLARVREEFSSRRR
jgi:endonuclease/exonuclease/phosphatase family metal-dependent hydrolase